MAPYSEDYLMGDKADQGMMTVQTTLFGFKIVNLQSGSDSRNKQCIIL